MLKLRNALTASRKASPPFRVNSATKPASMSTSSNSGASGLGSKADPSHPVKSGSGITSVCYIANTGQPKPWHDGSTRYRCYYPAEYLNQAGLYAGLVPLRHVDVDDLPDADIYVFHRPPYTEKIKALTSYLKSQKRILIADYDDLIFGVGNTKISSQYEKGRDLISLSALFSENARALRLFDFVTVSTPELARQVAATHPNVRVEVVRNGFPSKVLSYGRQCLEHKSVSRHRIGYFPGTRTHDKDFRVWSKALEVALSNTGLHLHITGELSPEVYSHLPNTTYTPGGSFISMFSKMTEITASIAPLQNNAFNASKSNIKAIESFLVGCYAVASELNDTSVLVDQGADILMVTPTEPDLQGAFEALLDRPPVSLNNFELVQDKYRLSSVCAPLLGLFEEAADHHA